jgi:hypothetical protein
MIRILGLLQTQASEETGFPTSRRLHDELL